MELFDTTSFLQRNLISKASSRNAIGHVAEEFVARVLHVEILPVDGSKAICPDFKNGEIKSVGRNKRVLIYKWRLEKEVKCFNPEEYFYVFACHTCPVTVSNVSEIATHFKLSPPRLVCVSLKEVANTVKDIEPRKFSLFEGGKDKRIGYNRKGYDQGGWQFSVSKFNASHSSFKTCLWQGNTVNVNVNATSGGSRLIENLFCLK
jgi:hypothetical protein